MSLTPDEYVNERLKRLEEHDAITTEKAYQNERRINDFISNIAAKISAINAKIEILMWGFFAAVGGLVAVFIELALKKK